MWEEIFEVYHKRNLPGKEVERRAFRGLFILQLKISTDIICHVQGLTLLGMGEKQGKNYGKLLKKDVNSQNQSTSLIN